jgi:hypothetical protein
MAEKVKIWITKYALSEGIIVIDDAEVSECQPSIAGVRSPGCYGMWVYYHGKDWHRTPEEAEARAEDIRIAKIESLKKQIAKLSERRILAPAS